MRRDVWNQGCSVPMTLGVTYDTMYLPNEGGVPANYHSPRQTITVGLRCESDSTVYYVRCGC